VSLADGPFRPVEEKEWVRRGGRRREKVSILLLTSPYNNLNVDALEDRGKNLDDHDISVRYSRMLA